MLHKFIQICLIRQNKYFVTLKKFAKKALLLFLRYALSIATVLSNFKTNRFLSIIYLS